MKQATLYFGAGNKKLASYITHFSLPAGHSCPFADICHSKANRYTGKITDGKNCQVRCYAASEESVFKAARIQRWKNYMVLRRYKTAEQMAQVIQANLPKAIIVRIHVGGDYFSQTYFDAWLLVATANPSILFYGYTKSLPFWVKRLKEIPRNFVLSASRGGKYDHLIEQHNLRCAEIVNSELEAKEKNLPVDKDDSLAMNANVKAFALLVHGNGPKGSIQAKIHYQNKVAKAA